MRRRAAFVAAGLATTALLACQLIVGVDEEIGVRPIEAGAADANDASTDDAVPAAPCVALHPPPPPASGSGGTGVRFFAARTFRMRPRGAPAIGYDLDGRCTNLSGSAFTEAPCSSDIDASDDDGGVDNAFGRLLDDAHLFSDAGDPAGESFTMLAEAGEHTLVIQLVGWNGEPDDPLVKVSIVPATAFAGSGCDGGLDDGGPPRWNGCDVWDMAEGTPYAHDPGVVGGSFDGYVTGGMLVASDRSNAHEIGLGTSAKLHEAIVTAKIVEDNGRYQLRDTVIAGRIPAGTLLDFMNRIETQGGALCQRPGAPAFLKGLVCVQRDLTLSSTSDGTGKACDAMSFAIAFDAFEARLSGKATTRPPDKCEGVDTTCP